MISASVAGDAQAAWPFYENTTAVESAAAQSQQESTAKSLGRHVVEAIRLSGGVVMELRLCPAGSFQMGSLKTEVGHESDENIKTATVAQPFYLSTVPLTQQQYKAIMKKLPEGTANYQADYPARVSFKQTFGELLPAMKSFAPKGWQFGLPTEVQMEYATRAGTLTRWYSGEDEAGFAETAWYAGNSLGSIHPVGLKRANAWGFKDMLGNVWQWVVKDGWFDGKLVKGGAYNTGASGNGCRSANLMIQTVPSAVRVALIRSTQLGVDTELPSGRK